MNYKIDISLSTNEIYTLTFDYTFDESVEDKTVRLQIGDLMVETQDRRVVFKTTSSATCIKSNVRLENVNLYEGNFLDYDQHGEYTKESYLKGMTLFNYITETNFPIETGFQDFYVNCDFNDGSYYTIIIDVENNTNTYDFGVINNQGTEFSLLSNEITTKGRQFICGKFTSASKRVRVRCKTSGGTIKVNFIMVIKGQYNDYFNNNIKYFEGIGCVKSPTVFTHNKYTNITPYLSILHQNGNIISDDRTFIDIISTGRYLGVALGFYPEDVGCASYDLFAIEFDYCCEGKGTVEKNNCPYLGLGWATIRKSNTVRFDGVGHYQNSFICTAKKDINRLCTIDFTLNPDWNGTNRRCTISNFRVYKIDSSDEIGLYNESLVTTPNDLELYGVNESIYDKLDLTTGILYKNTGFYTLDETFVDATTNWSIATNEATGNVTFTSRQYGTLRSEYNFPGGLYGNAIVDNADVAFNIVNNNNIEIARPRLYFDIYSNNNYTVIIMPASYNVTTLDELRTWLQNNNMIIHYKLQTPYTEQIVKPKALRCYRNGSIITDSQQLVPELVTTLPITNKFETTKLINGKTYLVYFDGTATELNAGGETVIANPTSPCEFTCGSTKTLTITGTDIANVMVVEKEQKSEQHEINATSIHISKIITTNGIHNIFDEYQHQGGTQFNNDYQCVSTRDRNSVKINGFGSLNYAGFGYYPNGIDNQIGSLPQGTYRFRCKVKVGKIGDKYKINCSSNPNGNMPGEQFGSGEVTSTEYIENVDVITYIKKAYSMLFYTFYNGQQIEYYDISFTKLSDEDITSSGNIPNISYEETISIPSEPIILRGYGGLQDTYDIATGIVTKRVSQSIDSFDLEVLPSPETHTVTFDNMPVIYENGTVEFYTEHDLYPIAKFEVPSSNLYDVSNLVANKQYTIRNASQIYCNGQPVPVRDVMTFTASQLAKGEMVINNSNDKEPMIIEGNYGSRDIPNFKGARSVEALEISVDGEVNQPIFGEGGRK